ncbi:IMPACT family protein [Uliginosibacterium paludis]|uniref:YigZ family protein n=1 Tax=Uliginosibacterium paludis TaxID=1615952 RepID=A0ABV2CUF4_9RHOO
MPWNIAAPAHSELLIRKSRFIGCVQPVAGRAEAREVVASLWAQHPSASHVCWALLAGGESAAVDDGEPGGTAGRPMLDVLRLQDLDGVLATVVRYYGGIPLGAGGLVRAYSDSVAQALRQAERIPVVRLCRLACDAPYALEGMIRRAIEREGARLEAVAHGEQVSFEIVLPEQAASGFRAQVSEAGQGRIVWAEE